MQDNTNEVIKYLTDEYVLQKEKENLVDNGIIEKHRTHFQQKFSLENIRRLTPKQSLDILMDMRKRENMVYYLEFKQDDEFDTKLFGSIAGGSSGKYYIYHSNELNDWAKMVKNKPQLISDEKAIEEAEKIRQNLLMCSQIIDDNPCQNLSDYRKLIKDLEEHETITGFHTQGWVHKFLYMHFPEKLSVYHNALLLKKQLVQLKISNFNQLKLKEDDNVYILGYFFLQLVKNTSISQNHLMTMLGSITTKQQRTYYKYNLENFEEQTFQEMLKDQFFYFPLELDIDLNKFSKVTELKNYLREKDGNYPSYTIIWRHTRRLNEGDILTILKEGKITHLGKVTGAYEFASKDLYKHRVPVEWFETNEETYLDAFPKESNVIERRAKEQVKIEVAFENSIKVKKERNSIENQEKLVPLKEIPKKITNLLKKKGQVILSGPPGTGKTYWALEAVYEMIARQQFNSSFQTLSKDKKEEIKRSDQVELVVLHANYGYEEFVEGLRPQQTKEGLLSFSIQNGIFKELCMKAANNPEDDYYLVLDEINRTDLTKVFGELIFAIENTKRNEKVRLAVSKQLFSVPENLYVIGTMNNADKSVSLIDMALRRRFGFVPFEVDYSLLEVRIEENYIDAEEAEEAPSEEGLDEPAYIYLADWLKGLNQRIVEQMGNEGKDLQVGHAYFLSKGEVITEASQFVEILKYEIIPLLKEYTYGNTQLFASVIGEKMINTRTHDVRMELLELENFSDLVDALNVMKVNETII